MTVLLVPVALGLLIGFAPLLGAWAIAGGIVLLVITLLWLYVPAAALFALLLAFCLTYRTLARLMRECARVGPRFGA